MKKFVCVLLAALMALSMIACSGGEEAEGVAKVVADGASMTVDELIAKAKEETGDFHIYSTSSKTDKVVKAFAEKYGLQGDFESTNVKEKDFYTTVEELIDAGNASTDYFVTQNAISVGQEIRAGRFINYVPVVEGAAASSAYAFMLYTKEFTVKNEFAAELGITNIWDLADDAFTSQIIFKKDGEPINELMLMELITEGWAAKLAEAYDAKYGDGACAKAVEAAGVPNAGYLFIQKFLPKTTNNSSEGDIAKAIVASTTPTVGFGTVSKYKTDGEPDISEVTRINEMAGFKGFIYQFYAQISKSTDRPYTAMLFTNYLATEEGVSGFIGKDLAIYSSTSTVTADLAAVTEGYILENVEELKDVYAEGLEFIEKVRAQ